MARHISSCVALALVVAAGACGGGRTITSTQIAAIMPSAADAPAGTEIRAGQSGPRTLQEFVTSEDVRAKLRGLGFEVSYVTAFASQTFPADPAKARPGAVLYATFGVLLRDADAAHDGFTFYRSRSRDRAQDVTPFVVQGFGEDAFVFRFSSLDNIPLPGVAYLWRVDNALFSVVGAGNPGPDAQTLRTLARLIEDRANR